MRLGLSRRLAPVVALLACSAAAPALAIAAFGGRMLMIPMRLHFVVVAIAGLLALGAALGLSVWGARARDGRAVLVGTAFSTMGAMLFVHALATPTVLIGANGIVQLAGAGNLPAAAVVLALAAWPTLNRPQQMKPLLVLQGTVLAAVALVGGIGLAAPALIPILPGPGGGPAIVVLVLGLCLLSLLGYRAARTFLLTRRRSDLAVVVGLAWLGCAQAGLLLFDAMDLAFWLAHLLEVAGIGLAGVPVALDLRRGSQSHALLGDFAAVELVAEEEEFLGPRVRALMLRLAEKDPYTERHTRAVALLAVQVGEQLGLPANRLRILALGGLLHDIGKLSVPDRVLQKPAGLSDDEFAVIRRHPTWGQELLGELGGFAPCIHRLVLDHHERLDGKGYPRGLGADDLDLETRILTVCDVYDALISKRVYRDAWTQERALGLLHEESDAAFDPRCVAALEAVVCAAEERRPARLAAFPRVAAA